MVEIVWGRQFYTSNAFKEWYPANGNVLLWNVRTKGYAGGQNLLPSQAPTL